MPQSNRRPYPDPQNPESHSWLPACFQWDLQYRIFTHAYHHHAYEFMAFEEQTYLCSRFVAFVKAYNLVSLNKEANIPLEVLHIV